MGIEINGSGPAGYASTPITNINKQVSETKKAEAEDPLSKMKDSYVPSESSEDSLGLYSRKGQLYGGSEDPISKTVVDPELQAGDMQIPESKQEIGQIDAERIEDAKDPG